MQSICDNHTWELVHLPLGCTPITTKWMYKVKNDQVRNIAKLKARLVLEGPTKRREDLEGTFVPIFKWNGLSILVALDAHMGWIFFIWMQSLDSSMETIFRISMLSNLRAMECQGNNICIQAS